MPSLNKIILVGRLTRDPELRYTSAGLAVASFNIAVDRTRKDANGERQTDFFRCTAWRQTADFVKQYVGKGRLVAVEGACEINEYTANDGTRRTSVDVQCSSVTTLDAAKEPQGAGPVAAYPDDEMAAPVPAPAQAAPRAPRPAAAPAPRPAAPAMPAADDFDASDPFEDM